MKFLINVWKNYILIGMFCVPVLLVSSSCCHAGQASALILEQETQSTVLLNLLKEQEEVLGEALNSLIEAETALEESESQLTESQQELTRLKVELRQVKLELERQKSEVRQLTALLKRQENELSVASQSIANANDLLIKAKTEWEQSEKYHKQKESNLRNDRTMWQIISVLLGGAIAIK